MFPGGGGVACGVCESATNNLKVKSALVLLKHTSSRSIVQRWSLLHEPDDCSDHQAASTWELWSMFVCLLGCVCTCLPVSEHVGPTGSSSKKNTGDILCCLHPTGETCQLLKHMALQCTHTHKGKTESDKRGLHLSKKLRTCLLFDMLSGTGYAGS